MLYRIPVHLSTGTRRLLIEAPDPAIAREKARHLGASMQRHDQPGTVKVGPVRVDHDDQETR